MWRAFRTNVPWVYQTSVVVFCLAPFVWLLSGQGMASGGSLGETLISPAARVASVNTVKVALLVTTFAVVLAMPLVYALVHTGDRTRGALLVALLVGGGISLLVRTYAWYSLMGRGGPLGSLWKLVGFGSGTMLFTQSAVVVAMTHALFPFLVLTGFATTFRTARNERLAAELLGASEAYYALVLFSRNALRGVVAGAALVFVLSVGFYITPQLLGGGGGGTMMLGTLIDVQVNSLGNLTEGAALSLALVLFVVSFLLITKAVLRLK